MENFSNKTHRSISTKCWLHCDRDSKKFNRRCDSRLKCNIKTANSHRALQLPRTRRQLWELYVWMSLYSCRSSWSARPLPLRSAPPAWVHTAADGDFTDTGSVGSRLEAPHPAAALRCVGEQFSASLPAGTSPASSAGVCSGSCVAGGKKRGGRGRREGCAHGPWTPHRSWLEEDPPVDPAPSSFLPFYQAHFKGVSQVRTSQLYMAKFLAELLGCTLPDKGAPPLFEVRTLSKRT